MKISLSVLALLLCTSAYAADEQGRRYSERPEVQAFMVEMQTKHGFAEPWLMRLFDQADFKPAVIKAMLPPVDPQVKSWRNYRNRFIEPKRLAAGKRFWQAHADTIRRASEAYGVPESIIVAIIGIETIYGKQLGNFETFSAMTTLAFDYPPRASLFRNQLEELLLLAREEDRSPLAYRGSFAGALGLPQFLPGSIRRYATDFDENGRVDLTDPDDAIGSVARFLSMHGWVKDGPITAPARISDEDAAPLVALGIVPQRTPADMPGLVAPNAPNQSATLVDLVTPGQGTEYRLGYQNFYVITRYNRSSFYATTVSDFADALQAARQAEIAKR